jgi:hypothetical protein
MKIVCDPAAASEAMDTIDQRHEALIGHLWMAIRDGIEAHNTLEQSHGLARGTPAEFEKALAALIDVTSLPSHPRTCRPCDT